MTKPPTSPTSPSFASLTAGRLPDRAPWATPLLRASIRRSLRAGLAGVWVRGPLPPGGAILAPNHHSWWDGYVLREVAWWAGQDFRVMMTERQLARFPFLRRLGALGAHDLRPAARAAQAGAWVVIFPEGALHPSGPLRPLHPGAAWLAGRAAAPLVPVGLRVVLRGAQRPEAYVRFGPPIPITDAAPLDSAIQQELRTLDAELLSSDPEQPLAGYLRVMTGRVSVQDRADLPSRLLTWITGDR